MPPANREGFTVRLWRSDSRGPAGVGFVIDDRHIVTCAHVVNIALGREQRSQDKPGENDWVEVDFPLLGDAEYAPSRVCRVDVWVPPPATGLSGGDVAGLVLTNDDLPNGAGPARLSDLASAQDAMVYVFGFPGDPPRTRNGAWAVHRFRGVVGAGTIQIDAEMDSAIRAQAGYSGSPVVVSNGSGDSVIAMLAVTSRGDHRDAYAIPIRRLAAAWPPGLKGPYLRAHGFRASSASATPRTVVATLRVHPRTCVVSAIAISPDGSLLASADTDFKSLGYESSESFSVHDYLRWVFKATAALTPSMASIRLWDVVTAQNARTLTDRKSMNGALALSFSPDGSLLASGGADNTIRLWNPTTGENVRTLTWRARLARSGGSLLINATVRAVAFSPDGRLLASGGSDNTIRLWNPTTGENLRILIGHNGTYGVQAVAFSPDGRLLASGGSDNTIRLWNPTTGENIRTITTRTAPGRLSRAARTGAGLLLGADVWPRSAVLALAFSPDGGLLASGGSDNTIRLWNPTTGENIRTITTHTSLGSVLTVAFSPDGSLLASGGNNNTVRLWDPVTGESLRTLKCPYNWEYGTGGALSAGIAAMTFSQDGYLLATARGRSVHLWR